MTEANAKTNKHNLSGIQKCKVKTPDATYRSDGKVTKRKLGCLEVK